MNRKKTLVIAIYTSIALFTTSLPGLAAPGDGLAVKIQNRIKQRVLNENETPAGIENPTEQSGQQAGSEGAQPTPRQMLDQAREQIRQQKMEKLRKRGLQMVDKRIDRLERELVKIRSIKKISEEERAYLVDEIQSALDELAVLRSRIEQESDPQALVWKVKSIITNFRVYVVALPKIRALEAAERANWGAQRFDTLAEKIRQRIEKTKTAGKDVTTLEALLEQFNEEIESAKANISEAREAFKSMLIVDPGAARMSLQTGKSELKEARQDFKDAIAVLGQIRDEFKKLKDTGSSEDSPTAD